MNFETRLLQSFNHFEPLRPDRINQDINLVRLNQKRSVPNPGDAHFAFPDFRKLRPRMIASALGEKRRNQDAGQKIALVPVGSWTQADTRGTLGSRAIPECLANDIPPAFLWKTNGHFRESI